MADITSKKQKYITSKSFLDPETGEMVPMQVVQIEDRDFNFDKVWFEKFVLSIDELTSKRLNVAFYIIQHLDKENKFVGTYRSISEESGFSLSTVTKAMTALQKGDSPFLVKINSGAYRVNPTVIFKGSHQNRMGVCYEYVNELSKRNELEGQVSLNEKETTEEIEEKAVNE